MYGLTERDYDLVAKPIYQKVFTGNNAFDQPFSQEISEKVILYPVDYYLEQPFLDALVKAASIEDIGCYLTLLQVDIQEFNEPIQAYLKLDELIDAYISGSMPVDLFTDYSLFSAKGLWGCMVSHEDHAVLGGSNLFMKVIRENIPNLDCQIHGWLQSYKIAKKHEFLILDWLPNLLTHIYGMDQAQELLEMYSLP
jgi:hypothetical protein